MFKSLPSKNRKIESLCCGSDVCVYKRTVLAYCLVQLASRATTTAACVCVENDARVAVCCCCELRQEYKFAFLLHKLGVLSERNAAEVGALL